MDVGVEPPAKTSAAAEEAEETLQNGAKAARLGWRGARRSRFGPTREFTLDGLRRAEAQPGFGFGEHRHRRDIPTVRPTQTGQHTPVSDSRYIWTSHDAPEPAVNGVTVSTPDLAKTALPAF